MAVVPDPKTLLLPDENAIPSVLSDKFVPIFASFLGFSSVVASRYMGRRPVFSGIQHHIIATLVGAVGGKLVYDRYERSNAEKDAIYRHYIELHPEDFPMPG
ncbi:hypothetical protein AAG570_006628 [Ranatra chinensis]|uniref:NADH dehydrogenase [ubiquinone] 1 subunit C2 n=1 Tax=Ranatra chinensis TaxID=642074 RepID=A0ABD0YUJ8_9HEMI